MKITGCIFLLEQKLILNFSNICTFIHFHSKFYYMQISLLYTQQFFSSIVQQIFISPQWVVSKKKSNIDRKIEAGDNSEVLHADIRYSANGSKKITYYHGISIQSSLRQKFEHKGGLFTNILKAKPHRKIGELPFEKVGLLRGQTERSQMTLKIFPRRTETHPSNVPSLTKYNYPCKVNVQSNIHR